MLKTHGFWYVMEGYIAHLVIAANLEASKVKFETMYPGATTLYIGPASICNECNKYEPPIDRDVLKLSFPGAEPCSCSQQHRPHFMGDVVNDIVNPLSYAQSN